MQEIETPGNAVNVKSPLGDLPKTGLLRVRQVLQFVPVSASTWWAGVKDGRFPKPVKLSTRVTCWKASDIRALIHSGDAAADNPPHPLP